MHGVIIEQGPQHYQIIPRQRPRIELQGTMLPYGEIKPQKAQARIVQEDTGVTIVDWHDAQGCPNWTLTLDNLPAGGLYRLETQAICVNAEGGLCTLRGDMVHHWGVGDLVLVSGQSNATGFGLEPTYDPPEQGLAVLHENGRWDLASHPLSDGTGSTHIGNLEDINPRHSPWLHCARLIKRQTGLPVGIVPVSLGGTAINRWLPGEEGDLYPILLEVAALAGGIFTALLWYQGCSDATPWRKHPYLDDFTIFANAIRRDLNDPTLPIHTVQINRNVYPYEVEGFDIAWSQLRESQRQAARTINNVYVIPTYDLGLSDNVHNSSAANLVIGQRVAYSVLQHTLGVDVPGSAPDLDSATKIDDTTIQLRFNGVKGILTARATPLDYSALSVSDEQGEVQLATVAAWDNLVQLTVARPLSGPATVSAARGNNFKGCPPHDTASGMPLLAFDSVPVV